MHLSKNIYNILEQKLHLCTLLFKLRYIYAFHVIPADPKFKVM